MMTGSQVARDALARARQATLVDAASLAAFAPDDAGGAGRADGAGGAARHFDIGYSLADRYLQLRFTGVWDAAMFDALAAAYLSVVTQMNAAGGIRHLLVDATRFGSQPPEIADRFPGLIGSVDRLPDQRTACVVPVLVNRVQARQGGDLINARYFRTIEDAADWLFSEEA